MTVEAKSYCDLKPSEKSIPEIDEKVVPKIRRVGISLLGE